MKITLVRKSGGRCRATTVALLLILTLLALPERARAQSYAVTDLGTLGGTKAVGYAINNYEQIVGAAQTTEGAQHAFLFDHGDMHDLGTLGGSNSWAHGINDHGWMVGGAELPDGEEHAFLCTNEWADAGMMDLDTLGGSNSVAFSINGDDEMVGWAEMPDGAAHAFFLTNGLAGSMMDLGSVGGDESALYCLNDGDEAVGDTTTAGGDLAPIFDSNLMMGPGGMGMMDMGGMGAFYGQARFINNAGNVVGQTETSAGDEHAFLSMPGGMMGRVNVDLGTLGGSNSIAYCISDGGWIVGSSLLADGRSHAFLVTNAFSGMPHLTDLNTLIPAGSGWELTEARGLNASNQIVGAGLYGGQMHGFLLTPTTAPVQMLAPPASQLTAAGTPFRLHLGLSAGEPLAYQWFHDGSPIAGATNADFDINPSGMSAAGRYTATARNAIGTVAQASASVGMFAFRLTNGAAHLALAAPAGSNFRVDYSPSLGANAAWQTVTNMTLPTGAAPSDESFPVSSRSGFYRVIMQP